MADALLFNASNETIDDIEVLFQKQSRALSVWPENVVAVRAFMAVCNQWRVTTISTTKGQRLVYAGLDYAACEAGFRLAGIELETDDWLGFCTLEDAARKCLNGA